MTKEKIDDALRPIGETVLPKQPYHESLADGESVFLRKDKGTWGELVITLSKAIGTLLPNNYHPILVGRIQVAEYQQRIFEMNELLVKLKTEEGLRTGPTDSFIKFQREYSMNEKRVLDWARDKEKKLLDLLLLKCVAHR